MKNDVLQNARRLTTNSEAQSGISEALRADPGYLRLHHQFMQANWYQYIECTSMQVGDIDNDLSLRRFDELTLALLNLRVYLTQMIYI